MLIPIFCRDEVMTKILVTGALGFIGSNLIRYLLKNYKDVSIIGNDVSIVGLNRLSNSNNLKRLEKATEDKRFSMYWADFSKDTMSDAFKDIEYVIHLGAKTFVDYSIRDPQPFIESNVVGTYRILEEARHCKSLKKMLFFSTDEVYGSILNGSYDEDARLKPSNPYACTKGAGDLLAMAYHNTYHLPIIISRCENVYGFYQGREKVFPTFVRQALADKPLTIYGTGGHIRQWIYCDDVIRGVMTLLEKGIDGEVYHIAGNRELTNLELAKRILKALDKPESLISFIDDHEIRPGHDKRYSLSSSKLKSLGWQPQIDLDTGIPLTVNWYKDNLWWTNG